MNVELAITSSQLADDELHALTRDLSMTLNRETRLQAEIAEGPTVSGSRGVELEVGILLLKSLLTSGVAGGMFNVLKSYFERTSSLVLKFRSEDGRELEVRAENMSSDKLQRTIELAEQFLGDPQ